MGKLLFDGRRCPHGSYQKIIDSIVNTEREGMQAPDSSPENKGVMRKISVCDRKRLRGKPLPRGLRLNNYESGMTGSTHGA
jgi:hypothetical protein